MSKEPGKELAVRREIVRASNGENMRYSIPQRVTSTRGESPPSGSLSAAEVKSMIDQKVRDMQVSLQRQPLRKRFKKQFKKLNWKRMAGVVGAIAVLALVISAVTVLVSDKSRAIALPLPGGGQSTGSQVGATSGHRDAPAVTGNCQFNSYDAPRGSNNFGPTPNPLPTNADQASYQQAVVMATDCKYAATQYVYDVLGERMSPNDPAGNQKVAQDISDWTERFRVNKSTWQDAVNQFYNKVDKFVLASFPNVGYWSFGFIPDPSYNRSIQPQLTQLAELQDMNLVLIGLDKAGNPVDMWRVPCQYQNVMTVQLPGLPTVAPPPPPVTQPPVGPPPVTMCTCENGCQPADQCGPPVVICTCDNNCLPPQQCLPPNPCDINPDLPQCNPCPPGACNPCDINPDLPQCHPCVCCNVPCPPTTQPKSPNPSDYPHLPDAPLAQVSTPAAPPVVPQVPAGTTPPRAPIHGSTGPTGALAPGANPQPAPGVNTSAAPIAQAPKGTSSGGSGAGTHITDPDG